MNTLKLSTESKVLNKCRCCIKPAVNCIKLESLIDNCEDTGKTYKEILNEITKLDIPACKESSLPQQICKECGAQLINSYKFIQQVCKISQQYLRIINEEQNPTDEFKNLHETFMELKEIPISEKEYKEMKIDLLIMECNPVIKEEKQERETVQQKRDFFANFKEEISSEDSDEPESLKDYDLSKEPIARCCDICHKVYRNEQFLNIHKRYTHMPDEDKLPCPLCTYKASRTSALKVHMGLVHGMDKVSEFFKTVVEEKGTKYPCNLCAHSYARKDSLRRHMRRNHQKKTLIEKHETDKTTTKSLKTKEKERFLCTYCGKSYSLKSSLEIHILSHTGERPHPCEICNKTFKRLMDLQLHRLTHSDEKPHTCTECGKGFKRVDKLKFHMRVHSELRPYKCNECEKSFKYSSVLKTHMHTHTGETPFVCRTCGEAYALRTSLNNHCLKYDHEKYYWFKMSENSVQKCRTCLKNSTKTFPLTKYAIGSNPKKTYGQLLKEYANLQCPIDYERYMPQYLCLLCCRELRNVYTFIRQAQYCNNKLINVIAKQLASLKEKAIILPQNGNKLEKSLNIKLEKNIDDCNTNQQQVSIINEFRIVSTSVLLKSEVLEETAENEGPIQYYVDDNDEMEINENDKNDSNDSTLDCSMTSDYNITAKCLIENNDDSQINTVCPICDKIIYRHDNLVTHMRTQHDFEVPKEFLNIPKPVLKAQMFACKKCPCKFATKIKYLNHVTDIHGSEEKKIKQKPVDKIIKCRFCDYTSRNYSALNFHNRSKHGTEADKFKCKFCPYMTWKKFSLLTHVKNSHKELIKTLKADAENNTDQGETLNNVNTTNTNVLTTSQEDVDNSLHENEDSSTDDDTPLVQKNFKSYETSEMEDNKKELSEEMFIRNICNIKKRQCNTISTRSLPRRCDICGNIYNNYNALKTHQKTVHIGIEKYCACSHCGKKFKRKANLRIHIKNAHVPNKSTEIVKQPAAPREKRFMCTECFYVCGTITTLTIHRNRHHTGEKPFKCDICFKSFIVPYDLKIHRYLHTGERPYKCPFCSKGFRCSAQLIKHKRIHNNERPYKCKDCGKSFTQTYNLSLHKRTHLKEKKLNCTVCDKLFENQSLLNLHRINENHPDEV
ncbi:zinc finger protein 91-like [Calliphora vicina]|uniref:zinc finger protein 91-like n=1 Tax=Calliphora vicina TaxID=7373 RepID=UPI00325BD0C0